MNTLRPVFVFVGLLMLACAGSSDRKTTGASEMSEPTGQDGLRYTRLPEAPFTLDDYVRWQLEGDWTWHIGFENRPVEFSVDGQTLVLQSTYGTFRGGEIDGTLVLRERESGPGPELITWVNLSRSDEGTLVGGVIAGGDEDELSQVTVRRPAQ